MSEPDLRESLNAVGAKVLAGERISAHEAELLLQHERLTTLGALADLVRRRLHPERIVTYIIDRNINYTNVCNAFCAFCAFYRRPHHDEGYVLDPERIEAKIRETYELGGNQILLQGGHNPDLKIDYYESLFRRLKASFPDLWLHALSPPEIVHVSRASRLPLAETIRRLREAGLDSIPGGGAEILVDEVRERLAKNKCSSDEWLAVMEEAHHQGMRSTATMMFGHVESRADRVEHLLRIRELQDRTGGFTAFICWTYQTENTELGAAALAFGVDDMGSTMIEENVVSAAGTIYSMGEREIVAAIHDAGFTPRRRDMTYSRLYEPGPA